MNVAEVVVTLAGNLVIEILLLSFFYGKLVERVKSMKESQVEIVQKLGKIDRLDSRLTRMETFVEIFIKRTIKVEFAEPDKEDNGGRLR